jgi:hypothetical protein
MANHGHIFGSRWQAEFDLGRLDSVSRVYVRLGVPFPGLREFCSRPGWISVACT